MEIFTQNKLGQTPLDLMINVTPANVEAALERVFPGVKLTERKLQSMVIYLGLNVNLDLAKFEDLKQYIGGYLHVYYPSAYGFSTIEADSAVYWMRHIYNRESIPENTFDFLCQFSTDSLNSILIKFNIFRRSDIHLTLQKFYPLRNILCFLCDSSSAPTNHLILELPSLKSSVLSLKGWDSRINWFKSGSHLNQKKIDAANSYFHKQKVWPRPFLSLTDVIDFFYGLLSDGEKELIFRKIRANYLNKKSRDDSDAKQCNFSLRKNAEKIINEIAKSNGVTRSIALNAILYPENKEKLQELFKKGIQNLPVQIVKSNDVPLDFSFSLDLGNSTEV